MSHTILFIPNDCIQIYILNTSENIILNYRIFLSEFVNQFLDLCARMRRGYLYSKAKELGCNKIALGHHYDDVIETILMGMLYGAQVQTMMLQY